MAKKNALSAPPPGDHSALLDAYFAAVKVLRDQPNRLNGMPLGKEIFEGFDTLENYLRTLDAQVNTDAATLAALEALLRQYEALLQRLQGIDFDALNPDRIRQQVLDALAGWQQRMEADLAALRSKNDQQDARLDSLEQRLKTIADTLAGLDFEGLKPEKIRQQILDALAPWRSEIGNAIIALQTQMRDLNSKVEALNAEVARIASLLQGVDFDALKPEKIKQQVLDALNAWQRQIESELNRLASRLTILETCCKNVEAKLTQHDNQLKTHSDDILKLNNDLKALSDEVNRIIAKGGVDPEDIKNRVLAALEAWKTQVNSDIRALTDRLIADEKTLGEHTRAIADLERKIAELIANPPGGNGEPVDLDALKNSILNALNDWKNEVNRRLGEHDAKHQTTATQINDLNNRWQTIQGQLADLQKIRPELTNEIAQLKNLLENRISAAEQKHSALQIRLEAEVKRLDARIDAIKTTGVDPAQIRAIIEAEFNAWKTEITTRFERDEAEIQALKNALQALADRVLKIETQGLDLEKIRELIQKELQIIQQASTELIRKLEERIIVQRKMLEQWQIEVLNRLAADEDHLSRLALALDALRLRVDGLQQAGVDPDKIRTIILESIAEWQTIVNNSLEVNSKHIQLLKDHLDRVSADLDTLSKRMPDAATLQQRILEMLKSWQTALENNVSGLDGKVGKAQTDIAQLRIELNDLISRVNQLILTGGTSADIEKRIREAILSWEQKLKSELDAIRQRNDEDRKGLLQLRSTLDALQERVRLIEIRDFVSEVKAALEATFNEIRGLANQALQRANAVGDELDKLTRKGGALDVLEKQIHLLADQLKTKLDEKQVRALLNPISEDIQSLRLWAEKQVKLLTNKHLGQEEALEDLRLADENINKRIDQALIETGQAIQKETEQRKDADERLEKRLDKNTGILNDKIADVDRRADARLDLVESRLNADDRDDKAMETRLRAAIGQEGRERSDEDEKIRERLDDLQSQIDNWKPDESGDVADRLARRCLNGRGIICGFDVWHGRKFTIYVGPGAGVTSDGHLMMWRSTTHFTHFKPFDNADAYPFFVEKTDKKGQKKAFKVWQLVAETEDETQPGVAPLSPQKRDELDRPFIQNKIVIAILPDEMHPSPQEVTFVLMHRDDAVAAMYRRRELQLEVAAHPDDDFLYHEPHSPLDELSTERDIRLALQPELSLAEIPLPRFGFHQPDDCSPMDIEATDFPHPVDIGTLFSHYSGICSDVFRKVQKEMGRVTAMYHRLLFPQFSETHFQKAIDVLDEKWTDYQSFCKINATKPKLDARHFIQYFYDWARDLLAAYHELRTELLQLMAACCIRDENDPRAQHPRHLMLGLAMRDEHDGLASPLRHEFAQPPIYNGNAARLETCRLYFKRWFLLLSGFVLPVHPDPDINPVCHRDEDGEYPILPEYDQLKITPGRGYFHALSRQSIPFYYLVSLGTQSVHRYWDYRRSKTASEHQHLCYHANDSSESYSALPHVIRPLHYSLDGYDFYRIEGHIGQTAVKIRGPFKEGEDVPTYDVVQALAFLVKKYNLDFDVKPVKITELQTVSQPQPYTLGAAPNQASAYSFDLSYLGAEHLAGVPKGGTFVLVTDDAGKVLADFALPYRCCEKKIETTPVPVCGLQLDVRPAGPCDGSKMNVNFTVEATNPVGKNFKLLDGSAEMNGSPFAYQAGGKTVVTLTLSPDGREHTYTVVDDTNSECKASVKVTLPVCDCQIKIEEVGREVITTGQQVRIRFKVSANKFAGRKAFIVIFDNGTPVTMNYTGDETAVESLFPIDQSPHAVSVQDSIQPTCSTKLEFNTNTNLS